jgi:hypothetical protein
MRPRPVFCAAALGVALLNSSVYGQSSTEVQLSFTSDFIGGGPFPANNSQWIAVTDNGKAAIDTAVTVEQIQHGCTGSATRIKAVSVDAPLFMVRGSSRFRAGPLDTVFTGQRFIYPGEGISLKLGSGAWFGLHAYGSATPDGIANYQIEITQGSRRQRIADFPEIDLDGKPVLIWAGDLDRDTMPDVIFDLTTSYAGRRYVLFLSSSAEPKQVVKEAATFLVSGC